MSELWERQPGEPPSWWDRFERFRLLGAGRTIQMVWGSDAKRGAGTKPSSAWTKQIQRWRWWERAQAWDQAMRKEDQHKWEQRRDVLRDREWKIAQAVLDRVETMLMFPLMRTSKTEDGHTTIIEPVGWKITDMARLSEVASKISRLASEMATENLAVDWRDEARKNGIADPEAALRAAVAAINGELAASDDGGGPQDRPGGAPTDGESPGL